MEERCLDCGFAPSDYLERYDLSWLRLALRERAGLIFAGLGEGRQVGGFSSPEALAEALASRLAEGDLHGAVHLSREAAAESARLGLGEGFSSEGRILQLNISDGGVPKLPVERAEVGWRGLAGDRAAGRKHHGHAWQALSLWSREVIDAIAAEGHPIAPGLAGENITITGLDWAAVRTGLRLEIGAELVCELTGPAAPCRENKAWFLRGDFGRMSDRRHPGSSRWYAAVLRPGALETGDVVRASVPAPVA